jgi:hypothetical protein
MTFELPYWVTSPEHIVSIAKVCHEANRAYCETLFDYSQKPWGVAEDWQKDSVIKGVEQVLANPGISPSASHEAWLAEKKATGWKYGPIKDTNKKEHPCFVPYEQLPKEQKRKDALFLATVKALLS